MYIRYFLHSKLFTAY